MSNYKNIKPYADFSHMAAQYGGPQHYVKEVAKANFAAGIEAEKSKGLGKTALGVVLGVVLWEGGKAAINKYKEYHRDRLEVAINNAEKANKECVDFLRREGEKEKRDIDKQTISHEKQE